jgi:hypothetical protein
MRLPWVYLSEKVQALRGVFGMTDGMWIHRQIHKHDLYETCISCKELTGTPKTLEGAGQMCRDCWEALYPLPEKKYDELG